MFVVVVVVVVVEHVTMRVISVEASRSSSCLLRLLLHLECDARDDGDD